MEINIWGTTLSGMLSSVYRSSSALALYDLLQNDPEFLELRSKIPFEALAGRSSDRASKIEGTYKQYQLIGLASPRGFDSASIGGLSFDGEKKKRSGS